MSFKTAVSNATKKASEPFPAAPVAKDRPENAPPSRVSTKKQSRKLKKQYADAQAERQTRQHKAQILVGMIESLRSAEPTDIGFDEKLWNTTVDHVTVNRDETLVFTMRDGREIRVKR